ncbi:MAG TPA: DUF1778 domain-containing protein [Bryobacteraceae bacterium]|nr:DUF1778 domain-containing protein [Bryobacteraceae bacterium]
MEKQPSRPMLMVQMSEEEKDLLREAAKREGYLQVSVWVRKTLFGKAQQVLKKRSWPEE